MRKIVLACSVIIIMMPSCKPNYVCKCYAYGDLDTTVYLGEISLNQAKKNCTSFNSLVSGDSCVTAEGDRK